jgi:hypothetical protein
MKIRSCRDTGEARAHRDDVVADLAVLLRNELVVQVAGDGPQDVVGDHQGDQLVLQGAKRPVNIGHLGISTTDH